MDIGSNPKDPDYADDVREGENTLDDFVEPDGSGCVMGDNRPMPMRDAVNVTDTYGADVGMDAKNRIGSITSATKSDEVKFA